MPAAGATSTPTVVPTQVAFADLAVELVGPAHVGIAADGDATVSYALLNDGPETLTVRFETSVSAGFHAVATPERLRVGSGDVVAFEAVLSHRDPAVSGGTMTVSVVVVGESERRRHFTTELAVGPSGGLFPEVGDDVATTPTSERVTMFVTTDDADADGDLDPSTLRIVGGGFLGEQVTASPVGTIEYVPFEGINGVDQVVYEVCDRGGRCDTGALTVEIRSR